MRGIVVRQSAVLEDRDPSLGEWREISMIRALQACGCDPTLVCSSFDHYAMASRSHQRKITFYDRVLIYSPGYSSTSSIARIFDAWIFSVQLWFYLLKNRHNIDFIIVSYPTPESTFVVSLFSKYAKILVDIRDAWPSVFDLGGIKGKIFNFYCYALCRFSLARAHSVTAMSEAMRSFGNNIDGRLDIVTLINPINARTNDSVDMSHNQCFRALNDDSTSTVKLFFAGTLNLQFDFSIIDAASSILKSRSVDHKFIIAGGGESLDFLRKKYSSSEIQFLGQIDKRECDEFSKICDGFFCFYREHKFEGHLTNKMIDYLRFSDVIFHNLGRSFQYCGQCVQIGHHIDTAEELFEKIFKLANHDLETSEAKSLLPTLEGFGSILKRVLFGY